MTTKTEGVKAGNAVWSVREITDTLDIAYAVEEGKSPVADIYDAGCSGVPHTEVSKRARLIAAAPDLFEAAKNAVDHLQSLQDRGHANDLTYVRLGELEAAIAKAQGPSNG